jgi:hypothetical protein
MTFFLLILGLGSSDIHAALFFYVLAILNCIDNAADKIKASK